MTVDLTKPGRPRRALAMPDLKPYVLGGGRTVRALGSGSVALGRRLRASGRLRAQAAKVDWRGVVRSPACWAGVVFAVVAVWSVVGRYVAAIGGGLVVVWVVLALMHSRPEPVAVEPEPAEVETPAGTVPADPREAFLQHLRHSIGNRPGIHLRELITRAPLERCTIADIRALCDAHGVPVRASQKVAGETTVGIRLTDLLALSPEEPQEAPLAG